MIGKIYSNYKILEKLGEGGMGEVFLAEDIKLKRKVALKFLPQIYSTDKEARKRFTHEAQAASALDHPNICTIHEICVTEDSEEVTGGQFYIVMAYYEGQTLKEKIKLQPLNINEAIKIAIQICEGLKDAHEHNIIHRDIKPANIIITENEIVKILDFGLAKVTGQTQLTKMNSTLGTLSYMSPEQTSGNKVDHRTDIWSLGVILYEMLTGQLPFKGEYDHAISYSILNEDPEPVTGLRTGIPMDLERILDKTIKKNPDERYQNINDLLIDLKDILSKMESGKSRAVLNQAKPASVRKKYLLVGTFLATIILTLSIIEIFFEEKNSITSIAILPLENLSSDKEQEYFVDGMTDALISELANISALRVISRTSIMQYKKVRKPLQEIANELKVDALVEGTILYDGNKIRITVQLIKANPEQHLWASNYERNLRNIFELQGEVAQSIANEINVTITPDEQIRLSNPSEVDPEVYKLYLKGYYNSDKVTPDGFQRSYDYYTQAIEKDSNFALAYVGLAEAYLRKSFMSGFAYDNLLKFKEYSKKAIELDKTQSNIHRWDASLKFWYDWDMIGAEKEILKALELNPNSAKAHDLYCNILIVQGRFEEAIIERQKAIELDPLSHVVHCSGCYTYYAAQKYDEAIELSKKTIEQFGSACSFEDQVIGWSYIEKGIYDQAIDILEKRWEMSTRDLRIIGELSRAYALSGQKVKAKEALRELYDLSTNRHGKPPYYLSAITLVALGEYDQAIENLEKSYNAREIYFPYVKVDQRLSKLNEFSRFTDIKNKLSY